jgi:hypothetical protein
MKSSLKRLCTATTLFVSTQTATWFPFVSTESIFFRHLCKQLLSTHHWQVGSLLSTSYFKKLLYLTANIDILHKGALWTQNNWFGTSCLLAGTYASIQTVLVMTFNSSLQLYRLLKVAHLHYQSIYSATGR